MLLMLRRPLSRNQFSCSDLLSSQLGWMRGVIVVSIFNFLAPWPTASLLAAELTFQAQSCGFSAVRAAVQDAIDSGANSVVNIPAGTCNWGDNELVLPGGISLKGSGKATTVLRSYSTANDRLITIDCSNGKTARFSDMTLIGKGNSAIWDGGLALRGGCRDFKVFNSRFSDFVFYGVGVWGDSQGVIYRNDFLNNYRAGQTGGTTGYGVVVYGNGTWPPLELGTANAVFVEDNYFSGNRHNIASNNGSRYVFRYNSAIATSSVRDFSMVDAHGRGSSTRGSRSWEIYNNTFSTELAGNEKARSVTGIRGGDGVVFNNIVTASLTIRAMIELSALEVAPPYPSMDQMRSGYFWNNSLDLLVNQAPSNFVLGRDYFLTARPGYTPYVYPHPLRSSQQAATPPVAPSDLRVE